MDERGRLLPILLAGILVLGGCAAAGGMARDGAPAGSSPRPGSTVVVIDFVHAFENTPGEPYYPLESPAGIEYSPDGTLIFCDEMRGKVYGLDASTRRWFEFATPASAIYQPIDVRVDGFRVLVLDQASATIQQFDLSGAWRDELLDVRQLDPGAMVQPACFAVDRDGRLVIGDVGQQEVLLTDSFLTLHTRIGGPGSMADRFQDPVGVAFRDNGSFLVADRGNRRLGVYDRYGFYEGGVGGDFDRQNPFVAPQGLAIDHHGNVFVADPGSGLIHVLNARLEHRFSVGLEYGPDASPLAPVDLAIGPNGELAVTDRARAAILVYRIVYR